MKVIFIFIGLSVLAACLSSKHTTGSQQNILVFYKTEAFHHVSIAEGKLALLQLGIENNWAVDTTADASLFTTHQLKKYKAIVFLNTSGNVFNDEQKSAFKKYIQSGGAFIGIHAASDTEKKWPWYNDLVGAYFKGHPKPQEVRYDIIDKKFPATAFMQDTVRRLEEIYNFYNFKKDLVKVIMTVDEKSYTGGDMGDFHPAAWYHTYDGGKAFFTAWGHHPETFKEEIFLKHITGAVKWALR